MKILILGDTGFIGKNFYQYYKKKGVKVRGFSKSNKLDLKDKIKFKKMLLTFKPSYVINCAAYVGSLHYVMMNPAKIFHNNMHILLNIYKVLSELDKKPFLVNLISNCAYPGKLKTQNEENFWNGIPHESSLPYGSTRRFISVLNKVYYKETGLMTKNFILPGVYGPGDHIDINRVHALDGLIIRMILSKRSNNKTFEIWGSGKPLREWIFVTDVVKLIDKLMKKNLSHEYLNLGQKKGHSILQISKLIKKHLNYNVKFVYNKKFSDGDPVKILDNKNLKKYLNNYKFEKLEEGIKKTIKYYNEII